MKNYTIALITGGRGPERAISLQSAKLVKEALSRKGHIIYEIDITQSGWWWHQGNTTVDLNDCSLTDKGKKICFDVAYIVLHGTPAEDGKIQAYFDMQGIPYTGSSALTSALTFNKFHTKQYLKSFAIPMPQGIIIKKKDYIHNPGLIPDFTSRNYPVFVKPNQNGSSYGASKVSNHAMLHTALEKAFLYDTSILIEEYIAGRECTCGAFRNKKGTIIALPITEIKTNQEFFDFAAKYENKSQEITPADFTKEQTQTCQNLTKKIYNHLNCDGCIRVDFILDKNTFFFLEVNTIPGLSPTSIIPQQLKTDGYNILEFLEKILPEKK